ncbi:hypothetical protein R84981_002762 [Carnimonas sp. R-84981]
MNGEDCILTSIQSLIFISIGLSFTYVLPWSCKVDTRSPRVFAALRGLRYLLAFSLAFLSFSCLS